jgi:hypothetical protein
MRMLTKISTCTYILLAVSLVAGGCSQSPQALQDRPIEKISPVAGEMHMEATRVPQVGNVVPISIAVANGTAQSRMVVPSQVLAITPDGTHVTQIPQSQAIRDAGGAKHLRASLSGAANSAAAGSVGGAIVGTGLGTAVGIVSGAPGEGAAYGAGIGAGAGLGVGAISGAVQGYNAAREDAARQVSDLCLRTAELQPKLSTNGYVFFPVGDYKAVEITVYNQETHDAEVLRAKLK